MLEYRLPGAVQTGAAVGPGLGALVYAGLYAVLPEAIAADRQTRRERLLRT